MSVESTHGLRVGVVVVAYNAARTLAEVLDRIPSTFRCRVSEVIVCDDASTDSTFAVGVDYQRLTDLPLTVIRRGHNLGYGGNQKAAYRRAIDRGLDVVVLLHGDGQYAPEVIGDLIQPFASSDCDAVFGSRMIVPGAARRGGMPLYKRCGNRLLTRFANRALGATLSEWHSGYRAYRVSALEDLDFMGNSDGFDFDTEIILQLIDAGKTIVEVPIPTYYGDEICYVNGIGYAFDVVCDVLRYRFHKAGLGSGRLASRSQKYELKKSETSSHTQLLSWLSTPEPKRVVDIGCADGGFAELARAQGHYVVGVDLEKAGDVAFSFDEFFEANLEFGLPEDLRGPFDIIVLADVLEHLTRPDVLFAGLHGLLAPGGRVLVSIPNFAHWYPRIRVAFGRFDYDRRGILDAGHLRFFTKRSFFRMVAEAGFAVSRTSVTGLPLDVATRGGPVPPKALGFLHAADKVGLRVAPSLFAYQLLFELASSDEVSQRDTVVERSRPYNGSS